MGIKLFSCGSTSYEKPAITTPNPNKFRFEIRYIEQYGENVVALVYYPDCTTFEGEKILVVKADAKLLLVTRELDPHFLHNNNIIARFRPDIEGWNNAINFAKMLMDD